VTNLREKGKSLENRRNQVLASKGLSGWREKRRQARALTLYEGKCLIAEKEFTLIESCASLSKTGPLAYYGKFFLSIFFFAVTAFWCAHTWCYILVYVYGHPAHPFFNEMLDFFFRNYMEFVSVILYIGLSMYLLYCAFLGNYKLGLRFYLPSFYPITKNETFMGGMLFSCWLGMIWCFTLL